MTLQSWPEAGADLILSREDHSIGKMVKQMEDRPKPRENADHSLQKMKIEDNVKTWTLSGATR